MAEFALIIDGAFREFRQMPERPVDIPHKKVQWVPTVREAGDAFAGLDGDNYVVRTPAPPSPIPTVSPYRIVRRVEDAGKSNEAAALLDQHQALKFRFLTIRDSIPCDDQDAITLVKALGLDPANILAPE